ncbi:PRC-barrel domain-containing protein [Acetobacter fallax]|uniref:PRC-barrel domain containing protein n=1 Tax=Acetobacter fallax TaxID=1737473 RepID=A0ABX0K8P6_9PROT|nr:PRC-barrel domain-containing protein [Acetobacter fallax]NHO32183.1 PRC-barrel domain containing protein [Acetobacter fallax]NHO35764.1 PRC-barrel domain containing protein [Acetobacter fallax]
MSDTMTTHVKETSGLIASDKVEGTAVYSHSGERLGTIANFMVNKLTGQVSYAVMSFGGFLGMGNKYHPLPWKTLTYDQERGGYVVDVTPEQLESAPAYSDDDLPNWTNPSYRAGIDDYYSRMPPL